MYILFRTNKKSVRKQPKNKSEIPVDSYKPEFSSKTHQMAERHRTKVAVLTGNGEHQKSHERLLMKSEEREKRLSKVRDMKEYEI
jgi:hypothetical protein